MAVGFTTNARSLKRGIAAWLAIAAAACHDPSTVSAGPGVTQDTAHPIEMLVANDAESVDPRFVTDAVGLRASRLLHAGLVRLDPATMRPIPYLAASFRWTGPLTLQVTLRDDVRFHSGAPFTADDVVATVHAFGSAEVGSRHVSSVEPIASIVANDPHTVTIVLRRPHATLLSDLELPMLRADQATSPPDPTGERLDGLGPYEVEHNERGQLRLKPAHFGVGGPAHHSVALRTVHDENARALRLYSGRADVALNGISPTLLPALDGRADLTLATTRGANLTYLVPRVDRGPMADVRLRRAISLAIDRRTITDYLFARRAVPADTVLPEGHWAAPRAAAPLLFDPEAARVLVRAISTDRPRVTLLTSTDRFRLTVARTMAEEMGDVGVDVEVVPLELGTLIARLNAGDFDLAALQIPELTEPNILRVFLHGSFIPPNGNNRGRTHDATLDALLDDGESEQDEPARADAYAKVEALLRDQLFIIPLWHEDQVAVVSGRARAFRPSPEGRWLSLAGLP
jgi:peptide/nickel transport system substrate-binding protein